MAKKAAIRGRGNYRKVAIFVSEIIEEFRKIVETKEYMFQPKQKGGWEVL